MIVQQKRMGAYQGMVGLLLARRWFRLSWIFTNLPFCYFAWLLYVCRRYVSVMSTSSFGRLVSVVDLSMAVTIGQSLIVELQASTF